MKKLLLVFSFSLALICTSYAQLIDASPELQTACSGTPATLTAVVNPPGGTGSPGSLPTNSYAVSSIPYTPDSYTAGTVVPSSDDTQAGPFPIGFSFCFFGTNYTQFYIGSNGWVAFSPQPTTYTSAAIPSTGASVPKNCIMGPWQDWLPGAANIHYQTLGVAPNRRLVVSWSNCPMFLCTSTLGTFQVVIYEGSNIIENYLQSKPNCLSWAGGTAVQGVHNAAGTVAFTVPGRNSTQWTAVNEGWRYTPNGTATYTINWYILPANTLINSVSFTIPPSVPPFTSTISVVPPTSPQFYYAEVVGPDGCGTIAGNNTDTVEVLSSALAVDAGPYAVICQGSSTTLNGSAPGAVSYSWSPATGLSSPSVPNPVASPSVTTTYTLTAIDGIGCTGTDTVTVGVNPAPFVDAGSWAEICPGDNISLSASGSGTFLWSPAATLDNATISTPTASPAVTTTYTLTVTDAIGCTATDTATVIVINVPADAGPFAQYCIGGSTTLNASGGNFYSWAPATALSSTSISNPVANPSVTTTYTVTVTDLNGCSKSDTVTVRVNPLPLADAGPFTQICIGSSTTLNASGGTSYVWSPATGLSSTTIANPVASPVATTTYSVTVTDAYGCSASDTLTVQVNSLPVVDAGSDVSICSGASTTLNATGAVSYVWSPSGSLSNPNIANPVATPPAPTTYTVTGTNASGCTATDTVHISLNGITMLVGPNAAVCAGGSTGLSASGAVSYLWSPASSLSSSTSATPTATPPATTTYTVIGTSSAGCADTGFVTITVHPLPLTDAGASTAICAGTTITLNGSGGSSYVWTPGSSLSNPNIPNPVATPGATTLYTLTATDLFGCSKTDTVTIFIKPNPVAGAGSNTSICQGTSTTLSGSGGGTYAWGPSTGLSSTTIAGPVATPSSTTTYSVTVTAANGCTATAQVTVTVNPTPVATAGPSVTICSGATTTLSAGGGTSFLWSPATGLSSPTSANPTATPSSTTLYVVTAYNSTGCSDTASTLVTVTNLLAMGAATVVPETCGDMNGSITAATPTGAAGPFTYSLNGGPQQSSATFTGLAAGSYTITATTAGGCNVSQVVNVGQVNGVNAAFTADPMSGVSPLLVNFTNGSTGASGYILDYGDGSLPGVTLSHTYGANGTYVVTLIAFNGSMACTDTARLTIIVFDRVIIEVPNVFTPNGDNVNDRFSLLEPIPSGLNSFTATIYNRWGRKVFEFDTPSGYWDGKIGGSMAEDGTYYYIIIAVGPDNKNYEFKGYVQLLGTK